MDLDQEKRGDVWVLTPHKNLTGGEETHALEQTIRKFAGESPPRIVIDLGDVSFLSSTGLGTLVAAHMTCQNRKGFLRLANITKRIRDLLIITRLALVFETFDSVDEAIRGVNRSALKAK